MSHDDPFIYGKATLSLDGVEQPGAVVASMTYTVTDPLTGEQVAPHGACPHCCTRPIGESVVCEHGIAIP